MNEDWVILEAVDEAMRPVPDGTLSATVLLTVLANDVQPFIRYDLGDCVRFHTDPCSCGSPFRSFQVEGREATLVRVGEVTLSPLVFDLEHEQAQRIQLVQTGKREFEVRMALAEGAAAGPVLAKSASRSIGCFAKTAWRMSCCGKARFRRNSPGAASFTKCCP